MRTARSQNVARLQMLVVLGAVCVACGDPSDTVRPAAQPDSSASTTALGVETTVLGVEERDSVDGASDVTASVPQDSEASTTVTGVGERDAESVVRYRDELVRVDFYKSVDYLPTPVAAGKSVDVAVSGRLVSVGQGPVRTSTDPVYPGDPLPSATFREHYVELSIQPDELTTRSLSIDTPVAVFVPVWSGGDLLPKSLATAEVERVLGLDTPLGHDVVVLLSAAEIRDGSLSGDLWLPDSLNPVSGVGDESMIGPTMLNTEWMAVPLQAMLDRFNADGLQGAAG